MAGYHVYITTTKNRSVLYTGVTNNSAARTFEHHESRGGSFTSKYKASMIVYFEEFADVSEAIAREKQIKAGSSAKKLRSSTLSIRAGSI